MVIKLFGKFTIVRKELGFTNAKIAVILWSFRVNVVSSWFLPGWFTQNDGQLPWDVCCANDYCFQTGDTQ